MHNVHMVHFLQASAMRCQPWQFGTISQTLTTLRTMCMWQGIQLAPGLNCVKVRASVLKRGLYALRHATAYVGGLRLRLALLEGDLEAPLLDILRQQGRGKSPEPAGGAMLGTVSPDGSSHCFALVLASHERPELSTALERRVDYLFATRSVVTCSS